MTQKTPQNVLPIELKKWLEEELLNPVLIDVREKKELSIA